MKRRRTNLLLWVLIFLSALCFGLWIYLQNNDLTKIASNQPINTPSPSAAPVLNSIEPFWHIRGADRSVIEFLVTDSNEKRTGYLSSKEPNLKEIPESGYVWSRTDSDNGPGSPAPTVSYFDQKSPPAGIYTVKVTGKKSGAYLLIFEFFKGDGTKITKTMDGTTKLNATDFYVVELPTLEVVKI